MNEFFLFFSVKFFVIVLVTNKKTNLIEIMLTGSDSDVCFFCGKPGGLVRVKCKTMHLDCVPCLGGDACKCKINEKKETEYEETEEKLQQDRTQSLVDFFDRISREMLDVREQVEKVEEKQLTRKQYIHVTGDTPESDCFLHRKCSRTCDMPSVADCLLFPTTDKPRFDEARTRDAYLRSMRVDDPQARVHRFSPISLDVDRGNFCVFFSSVFEIFGVDRRTPRSSPIVVIYATPMLQSDQFRDAIKADGSSDHKNCVMKCFLQKIITEQLYVSPTNTYFR